MKNNIFKNKRIGVFGKGGSGKSTVVVLLAQTFIKKGYQVIVLDADSTNFGLYRALGFERPPISLLDYFGGPVFSGGKVTCPVDDPSVLSESAIHVDDISEKYYAYDDRGLYLFQLGKIGERGPGAGCDGPISKITMDLRISGAGEKTVTLIDIKAGLEDFARGVITSMDWVITVVDPTIAAIQIADDIDNLISHIKAGAMPATYHLESDELKTEANKRYKEARIKGAFVILNKVKDKIMEKYLQNKLHERGLNIIGAISDDSSISVSWLEGRSLSGVKVNREMMEAVEVMEEELHKELAIPEPL